ncbi:MAG: TIGR03564 family F420-dependent LLM class oxidoreductase [Chloroflexota bacterium]
MKLGINYAGAPDVESHVQAAVEAENDGFETFAYNQIFGPDVLTVIAMAGERTKKIEFATAVVPTYSRHPQTMALQALTTQAATNGRFSLGIGLSHKPVVESMWGLSYDRPAVHMKEYLTIVNSLIKTGAVSFSGEFFKVNASAQIPCDPKPPVLIAALAPVMLKLAGEAADGTITWMVGPKTLETHIVPRINKAAEAAGRPKPRVAVGLPIAVTDDVDAARERAARAFIIYGTLPNYQRMLAIEGVDGPAGVAIVGNEKEVERQLRAIAAAGATEFAAPIFPVGDDPKASIKRTRNLLKSLIGKL